MKPFHLLPILALVAFLFAGCNRDAVISDPDSTDDAPARTDALLPGIAIVKFAEDLPEELSGESAPVRSAPVGPLTEQLGIKSLTRVFSDNERFLERQRREGLHRWYFVEFDQQASVTRAAQDLAALPGVEIAEPVQEIRKTATGFFNDTFFTQQWHLDNSTGVDLNVIPVWANYTTGDPNVIVAVIDGGIDPAHEDLRENLLPGGNGMSWNFVSGGSRIIANAHGTHVGGIIGATSNNGIGVAGIAGGDAQKGSRGVSLMSCQVFEEQNGKEKSGNFRDAFIHAADNGAVIANNSWGYVVDTNNDGVISAEELEKAKTLEIDQATKTAVDYFIKYAGCDNDGNQLPDSPMKGGLVIFAAGNDNIPYGAPANYEKVLAVASVEKNGAKSGFSNYGDWVDICAPGSGIVSTGLDNGCVNMSGTSMAAPTVSGIAALVVSHRGGQGFTNDMLWEYLVNGADAGKVNARNIGPLVDALGAIVYGDDLAPEAVSTFEASAASNNISVQWTVTGDENGVPAYGTLICASTDPESLAGLDPARISGDILTTTVFTYELSVGDKAEGTLSGLAFEEDYYVTLFPFSYGHVFASASPVVKVTTGANNAPVITADGPVQGLRFTGTDRVRISFTVSDPDGHPFTVDYVPGSTGENWFRYSNSTYILNINCSNAEAGRYSALLTATDSFGATTSLSVDYEILANRPPEVTARIGDVLMTPDEGTRQLTLGDYFTDPDGDELNYTLVNTNSNIFASTGNGMLFITPQRTGLAEITVTAKDLRDNAAEQKFRVAVRSASEQVSVYPTQVSGTLNIGTGVRESQAAVRIVSQGNGAVVLDTTCTASVFYPAELDLSGLTPGRYQVIVTHDGQTFSKNIVKI